jgi:hypothetical protein
VRLCVASTLLAPLALSAQKNHAVVTVNQHDSIGSFDPIVALGSTIDGHDRDATRNIFTPANVAAMKSANLHSISYRIRTELGIEAWHWNPQGKWSDANHARGYWTSDDTPRASIQTSYGYRLPRRGNTIDQANDDGYSRLTDGDTASFWKSSPYLDTHYTGDGPNRHPQWVIVDLQHAEPIDAIRIMWGMPFATSYDVQYWNGEQPNGPDDNADDAGWSNFESGVIRTGSASKGGDVTIRLSQGAVKTRWVRLLLRSSSLRAPAGSRDIRDGLGFAIREISLGTYDRSFHDIAHHANNARAQTHTYVSSTDPWHRESDRDRDTEQPGIDLMFASGLTRGLPMLLPVGVLYDTPDNAAALLRYVRRRRYVVPRIELGEEPDGQFVTPDDFAALYAQISDSLRAVDPKIVLGGPSLQDGQTKVMMSWKEGTTDERSWVAHFVSALAARGHMRDLAFVSFEFYPFDNTCVPTAPQLARVAPKIRATVAQFRREGVPTTVPLLMTEYGYSPFSGEPEMDRSGAIFNTEAVAAFLTAGGAETFFYGTEPSALDHDANCGSWGDNTLFVADDSRRIHAENATFHAAHMLTTFWADSTGGSHTLLRTTVASASGSHPPIDAYSLRRPDGKIATVIINRDASNDWAIDVTDIANARDSVDVWRFTADDYVWHPKGADGFARPNNAPRRLSVKLTKPLVLPSYSIMVMRQR